MHRLLKLVTTTGAVPFLPLNLFAAGEQGAWYDPSDLSTLFQDSAGTTPVTADGDVVGLVLDKSGNGNDLTQATTANKPLYKTDGVRHWLQFDGTDDGLATAAIDFTGTDKMSVWAGVRKLTDASVRMVAEFTNSSANNGSFYVAAPGNTNPNYGFVTRGTVTGAINNPLTYTAPITNVLSCQFNNGGGASMQVLPRINGIAKAGTSGTSAGNYANDVLYVGRRAGASLPLSGYIYSLIIRGAASNNAQIMAGESYVAGKTGVTI